MHAEHLDLDTPETIEIDLDGLFGEAGMNPGGGLWIVPTETFLSIWQTPVGEKLRERGFRMANDGKAVGVSEDCIIYLPRSCKL